MGGAAGWIIFGGCQASGVLSEQGSGQKQAERAERSAVGRRGASGGTGRERRPQWPVKVRVVAPGLDA